MSTSILRDLLLQLDPSLAAKGREFETMLNEGRADDAAQYLLKIHGSAATARKAFSRVGPPPKWTAVYGDILKLLDLESTSDETVQQSRRAELEAIADKANAAIARYNAAGKNSCDIICVEALARNYLDFAIGALDSTTGDNDIVLDVSLGAYTLAVTALEDAINKLLASA